MNVAIIDSIPLIRTGLANELEGQGLDVVVEACDLEDVLYAVHGTSLDLAISDVLTPTRSGLAIVRELQTLQPACKIMLLSSVEDPVVIHTLLSAGAAGYALKKQPILEVIAAVHEVCSGGRYLPPCLHGDSGGVDGSLELAQRFDRLTPREREVFDLVTRGYSNYEIAARLFISPRTAETHRHHILKKLGATSLADATRMVAAYRALDPAPARST